MKPKIPKSPLMDVDLMDSLERTVEYYTSDIAIEKKMDIPEEQVGQRLVEVGIMTLISGRLGSMEKDKDATVDPLEAFEFARARSLGVWQYIKDNSVHAFDDPDGFFDEEDEFE